MLKRLFFYTAIMACLFTFTSSFAQNALSKEDKEELTAIEDSLVSIADSMLASAILDFRIDCCVKFTRQLRTALDIPGSFEYPFDKLAKKIHIIYPQDKSFRIFNWMIAPATTVRRYYGAVQMAGAEPKYYPLRDFSEQLEPKAETEVTNADQWFGCEYYRIMDQIIDGRKAYLLFGFSANGMNSNKKLLDVLSFNEQGPVLGAPIFMMPDTRTEGLKAQSRIILEYKKTAQVFLNYDDTKKMIMFNRLASDINDPNRKSTYAPTGQTDGLRFENGQYIFVKDAIPILRLKDGQAPVDGVMQGG